jgi:hypothetical protein
MARPGAARIPPVPASSKSAFARAGSFGGKVRHIVIELLPDVGDARRPDGAPMPAPGGNRRPGVIAPRP